jgi:ferredoxin
MDRGPSLVSSEKERGMAIKTVWIEEGCILCNACDAECPDVFQVSDSSCLIKASVREDGVEDENQAARSPLKAELRTSLEAGIKAAASACPVEVIKFE